MGFCHLCKTAVPDEELLDHIRVIHPDAYGDGPETWPDGTPVIYDDTLTPADFDTPVAILAFYLSRQMDGWQLAMRAETVPDGRRFVATRKHPDHEAALAEIRNWIEKGAP